MADELCGLHPSDNVRGEVGSSKKNTIRFTYSSPAVLQHVPQHPAPDSASGASQGELPRTPAAAPAPERSRGPGVKGDRGMRNAKQEATQLGANDGLQRRLLVEANAAAPEERSKELAKKYVKVYMEMLSILQYMDTQQMGDRRSTFEFGFGKLHQYLLSFGDRVYYSCGAPWNEINEAVEDCEDLCHSLPRALRDNPCSGVRVANLMHASRHLRPPFDRMFVEFEGKYFSRAALMLRLKQLEDTLGETDKQVLTNEISRLARGLVFKSTWEYHKMTKIKFVEELVLPDFALVGAWPFAPVASTDDNQKINDTLSPVDQMVIDVVTPTGTPIVEEPQPTQEVLMEEFDSIQPKQPPTA